jgi:transcription antitermination factor NusA-like protein
MTVPAADPETAASATANASAGPVLRRPDSGNSDREVFEDLFARRVSQVADGSIVVVSAVRRPGIGAVVTVRSHIDGLDAVAACRGVDDRRVRDVETWFPGERITVVAEGQPVPQAAIA